MPCLGGLRVAVAQDREAQRHLREEVLDARKRLGEIHGQDFERLRGERVAQPLDGGHLVTAGLAPGGPEVHQHHLAAVIGQPVLAPLQVFEGQLRRRAARPALEIRRGRPLRERAGGEHDKPAH